MIIKDFEVEIKKFEEKLESEEKQKENYIQFLLEDIYDVGVVDIFTNQNKYLYWLYNGITLNEMINKLLAYCDSNPSQEAKQLLLRCVVLKEKIDENLIKYGKDEKTILKDLKIISSSESLPPIILKIDEPSRKMEKIKILHHLLIKKNFIKTIGQKEFISHFEGTTNDLTSIYWTRKKNELVALIKMLAQESLLGNSTDTLYQISKHFDYRGKKMNENMFRSLSSRVHKNNLYPEDILFIVDAIKN